jgi:hypothetical protein
MNKRVVDGALGNFVNQCTLTLRNWLCGVWLGTHLVLAVRFGSDPLRGLVRNAGSPAGTKGSLFKPSRLQGFEGANTPDRSRLIRASSHECRLGTMTLKFPVGISASSSRTFKDQKSEAAAKRRLASRRTHWIRLGGLSHARAIDRR